MLDVEADIFEARGRQTSLTTTVLNYEKLLHLDPSLYNTTPKETSFQMDFTKHFFSQHSIHIYTENMQCTTCLRKETNIHRLLGMREQLDVKYMYLAH